MYPREIKSTPLWIRHKLPLSPQPPPNGDEKLRNQIRSQSVQFTNETIEYYVRQERARLDLKCCLDEFFYWNVSNPSLRQLVIANIFGRVHVAYIIEIHPKNVKFAPTDMLWNIAMIELDDMYTAEPRSSNPTVGTYRNPSNPTGIQHDFIGSCQILQNYRWIPGRGIDVGSSVSDSYEFQRKTVGCHRKFIGFRH
ncbi:unnamed protein product [Rotaria magnacalcarata]|uniref:Uncharacterized protein n=2 Tax=Rotaria magnacalcarata TaxID=392030 RepID=A0A816DTA8_9BILA|nr:unnamed protein product [Rotaria magnacalcarata]CAF1637974.1 unnamed protein product [Rotaria magnacalcarata]CAF3972822.1 unnamed protein product [Rotaria magnacalcarata]